MKTTARHTRSTWTGQEKYRFRTVESKRYRNYKPALIERSLVDLLVSQHPTYDGGIRQIDLRQCVSSALKTISVREEKAGACIWGLKPTPFPLRGSGRRWGAPLSEHVKSMNGRSVNCGIQPEANISETFW